MAGRIAECAHDTTAAAGGGGANGSSLSGASPCCNRLRCAACNDYGSIL